MRIYEEKTMRKLYVTEKNIKEYRKLLIREEKGTLTVEKYIRDIRKFYEYADGKCISKQMVIDYKYYLENTGNYKISSINSFLASVNHYLEVMGYGDMKVKMIKVQKICLSQRNANLRKVNMNVLLIRLFLWEMNSLHLLYRLWGVPE